LGPVSKSSTLRTNPPRIARENVIPKRPSASNPVITNRLGHWDKKE
jgi:hypothetical protein